MGAFDTMLKTCKSQVIGQYPPSFSGNRTAVTNFCALLTTVVISHHKTSGVLDFEEITPLNVGWWVNGLACTAIDCVTVCLNSISIWIFSRRSTRSPTHLLLAIVSGLDLLTCVCQLPLQIHVYLMSGYKHLPTRAWCDVYNYLYNFVPATLHSTAFLLNMFLSVQRCVGVKNVQRWRLKAICSYKGTFISIAICVTASALVHALYPINIGVEGVETIGKEMLQSGKLVYVHSCKVSPRNPNAYNGLLSAYIWTRVVLLQTLPAVVLGFCNTILIITSYKVYAYRRTLVGKLGGIASLRNVGVPNVEVFKRFGNNADGTCTNDRNGNGAPSEEPSNAFERAEQGTTLYRRSISHEIQRNGKELCIANVGLSFVNQEERAANGSRERVEIQSHKARGAYVDTCTLQKKMPRSDLENFNRRDVKQYVNTPLSWWKFLSKMVWARHYKRQLVLDNICISTLSVQRPIKDNHVEENIFHELHRGSVKLSRVETLPKLKRSLLENSNLHLGPRSECMIDEKEIKIGRFSTWPVSKQKGNSVFMDVSTNSVEKYSNPHSSGPSSTANILYNQSHPLSVNHRTYSQPNSTRISKELDLPKSDPAILTNAETQKVSSLHSSNGELRSTLMLVLVTTLTLLAELFVIVMLIFQFVDSIALKHKNLISTSTLSMMFSLSNLVTLLTFPLNFFIFCGLSRSFREALQGGIRKITGGLRNIWKRF